MAQAMLSLWLMPDAQSGILLRAINRALGAQFGAPLFEPHLTLIGGRMLNVERLARTLPDIAKGISAFSAPVADVVTGEAFFQSFYALFAAAGPVLDLKTRCVRILDEEIGGFMPHVSLLYGAAEERAKEAARAQLARDLTGQRIGFDTISVVLSSDTVPVEDWRVLDTVRLG